MTHLGTLSPFLRNLGAEFLLSVIGLLFLSLTVEALQGKMCRDSLLLGGGRSVQAKISGGRGRPWWIFFGFYKTRHILLSDSANCTMQCAVVLTQYRRVMDGQTDGRTDGIAVASTAIAKRPAVKIIIHVSTTWFLWTQSPPLTRVSVCYRTVRKGWLYL